MAVTDQALLDDLQRAMIEPPDLGVTWPSGLWNTAEVVAYINQRLQRYKQETLINASWMIQPIVPNQPIHQLPQEWLGTVHLLVEQDGSVTPLDHASRSEVDLTFYGWQQNNGRPLVYCELQTGTLSLELVPTPLAGGTLHGFVEWLAQVVDGTGIDLDLPEELVPYLYYGVLADMFGKQGRAFDEPRRNYCEDRFAEGIAVGRAMFEAIRMP